MPEPGAPALLEIGGLRRSFYGVAALNGVDLTVAAGSITGLIGPNGAGKTTLFNCVSGLIPPQGGTIVFDGVDISGWRPDRITRRGLVRTFQIARGFPRLSVMENLLLYGADQPGERILPAVLRSAAAKRREEALRARARVVAARLNLTRVLDNPAADLILLDEPIAGINPTLAEEVAVHLETLRADGLSFLVIEHHMDMIARLCDPVIVMAEGRTLAEGSFAAIQANEDVQEAYMGRRRWAS